MPQTMKISKYIESTSKKLVSSGKIHFFISSARLTCMEEVEAEKKPVEPVGATSEISPAPDSKEPSEIGESEKKADSLKATKSNNGKLSACKAFKSDCPCRKSST